LLFSQKEIEKKRKETSKQTHKMKGKSVSTIINSGLQYLTTWKDNDAIKKAEATLKDNCLCKKYF